MKTAMLLASVEEYFPNLTEKTLRDWVKEGFLQEPERVGMGSEGGTPNEWGDDSVRRIKIIRSVTHGSRINKEVVRRALIGAGYFPTVDILRSQLLKDYEEFYNNIHNIFKHAHDEVNDVVKIKGSIKPIIDADILLLILEGLVAPPPAYDKLNDAYIEAGFRYNDTCRFDERVDGYKPSNTPTSLDDRSNPLYDCVKFFASDRIVKSLETCSGEELHTAFNDIITTFNIMYEPIAYIFGYDDVPPVDLTVLSSVLTRRHSTPQMEVYELKYGLRILLTCGWLQISLHGEDLCEHLPKVLALCDIDQLSTFPNGDKERAVPMIYDNNKQFVSSLFNK